MHNSEMFDAAAHIDEQLIERCLKKKNDCPAGIENSRPAVRGGKVRQYIPIAVAALLVIAIGLSALMIAVFSKKPEQPADKGLKIGFEDKDETTGARIAIETEKAQVNVGEDLPISIYSVCNAAGDAPESVTARVLMSYSRIDRNKLTETVKVIDDGTADAYTWNGSFERMSGDRIVVPAAVFTKADATDDAEGPTESDGVIVWALEVSKKYGDGSKRMEKDSAALYYKIEDNAVYLTPSDETLELVGTAAEKLWQGLVFFPGISSDLNHTLYDEYEHTAKWVAPELITLETKSDAALSMIKLYEDILEEYKISDIDGFYEYEAMLGAYLEEHAPCPMSDAPKMSEEHRRVLDLLHTRLELEALLALDCFYDQLDKTDVARMTGDFAEFARIDHTAASKVYDSVFTEGTMFDMYRSGRYGGLVTIEPET